MSVHDFDSLTGTARSDRLQTRLAAAKRAFTTRNVDLAQATRMVRSGRRPAAGDVILARVTALGQHRRIENIHGRRGDLYIGDEIIVAYGNRYAPDQFEAYVPEDLGPCHLVAGGGVAAQATCRHAGIRPATQIEVIGALVQADGRALNLADFALVQPSRLRPARVIAVVGSSMNAGKTTTVAGIVHGLTRAGFRVGAAKLTGTGSGGDLWSMRDAGAALAVDFTDAGHASTFGTTPDALGVITQSLLAQLDEAGMDIAVVEIADGLLQAETAALVEMGHAKGWFDGVVFAAADAMGAAFGCSWLAARGIAPLALSGLVSASPLASREAAAATGTPLATLAQLRDPVDAARIVFSDPRQQVAA
jgi:hypothetical protein